MFKNLEVSDEERARQENVRAREDVEKQELDERRRRERCVELACNLEETRAETLVNVAERIYQYLYGART
jgi:hypothetical protein